MRNQSTHFDTLYDELNDPSLGLLQRWGLRLLYMMDLSENLWRTADFVSRRIPNGLIALILIPLAYIIANTLGGAAFYFDFDSTRETAMPLITRMSAAALAAGATGVLLKSIQWMPTTFTLFPTAMELLGSKFAKFGTTGWQLAVWVTALFDLVTDAPRVNHEMAGMWHWATGGIDGFWNILFSLDLGVYCGILIYYASFLLALLAASYVVEVLFICSILVLVMLVVKSVGYWVLNLTLGLLAGKNGTGWAMAFIYKMFGTMDGPPPEQGPQAGRSQRQGRRNRGAGQGGRAPRQEQARDVGPGFDDEPDFGFES